MPPIDRDRLAAAYARELDAFAAAHPRSQQAYEAAGHLFGQVPMTWMNKLATGFPLSLDSARGSTVRCLDGHDYLDLALGDTGAMAGHSPSRRCARSVAGSRSWAGSRR